jgi:NAD(P)-dependent dehydrogenase (short-subunit alcohol dehydrogenase family)
MDLNLSGKVAVVTGASKGIGLAIARSLAAEGVSVVAGARGGSDELSELASRAAVHPVLVDLTTADGPARLVDEVIRTPQSSPSARSTRSCQIRW